MDIRSLIAFAAALALVSGCRRSGEDAPPTSAERVTAATEPAAPFEPAQPPAAANQPTPPATSPPLAGEDVDKAPEPNLMLSKDLSFKGGTGENCSFELESMPESMVFANWLELYDWMARDSRVDDEQRPNDEAEAKLWLHVKDTGSLLLAVIHPHAFYTSYAGVLEREDGRLQLWKLGQPEADDSCPLGVRESEYEPALGYMPGLETLSVSFEDSVSHRWEDDDNEDGEVRQMHGCSSANTTRVDLIVEPSRNISALLTRWIDHPTDTGDGPSDVIELRLEDDGLYVDGCGLRNKRLIPTLPGRPGDPD